MGYYKQRAGEDIERELTAILRRVKDPRAADKMLSVVRCEVASDLSAATVYISCLQGAAAAREAVKGLTAAVGFIRSELGRALTLRIVPALKFVANDSIEHGAVIARKLKEISEEDEKKEKLD